MLKKILKGITTVVFAVLFAIGIIALFIGAAVQQSERSEAQLARMEARYE